jgi:hypothetical protein
MKVRPYNSLRCPFPFTLLSLILVGCRTHQPRFNGYTPPTAPDVLTLPPWSDSTGLTREKVESIRSVLLKHQFKNISDVEAALPDGMRFFSIYYGLKDTMDSNGTHTLYNEIISVCRLNEDQDLVVVEDDRSATDIIQNWFIRDLPIQK